MFGWDPTDIYLFQASNGTTRVVCEICSNLKIKIPERHHCCDYNGAFIVKFEQISDIVLGFLLLNFKEKMQTGDGVPERPDSDSIHHMVY